VLRGAGRSYGDAAFFPEALVLDLSRMDRILSWDPATGVVEVEPGVRFSRLWRYVLGDGWWPAVVTGTMTPTLGGGLAMNVHGKNNWHAGTLGEHCEKLDLLLPSGELVTVGPERDPELFHAVIGGFGQLGIVVRARIRLKRVASGLLHVKAVSAPDLASMLQLADEAKEPWEYVVGWIDAFARGRRLGRGLLHFANHMTADEDPAPAQSLRAEAQDLPDTLLGFFPKSVLWRFLKPFTNRPGMRLINAVKYGMGSTLGEDARYVQGLAEFSFLLDYVPGWERIYLPGGLIQFQSFVPVDHAERVFAAQLAMGREAGLPSYLAVLKRHRPDPFLLTHGLDGFSLALDFPVTAANREQLWALVRRMAEPVVEAGGRFYPAKDAALPGELFRATFRDGELDRFAALKRRCDPEGMLRSALAERLL
ncbi:MAG TPA: FAD-binding oxidoreductase, partial [Acidobacteria bacterium]|nr:FAD-binding oxidoreductase [Acidobacteriota bacterium]